MNEPREVKALMMSLRAANATTRAAQKRADEAEAEVKRLREELDLHDAAKAMQRLTPEEVYRFIHWRESEAQNHD